MADNSNLEALIEARIEVAIRALQDLPDRLAQAFDNNEVAVLDMWFKIIEHMYNELISSSGTIRPLNDIEFPMVSDQDRPTYSQFIKVAYRWLVTMQCAGSAELSFENLAIFKPKLDTEVLELLAPHERQ